MRQKRRATAGGSSATLRGRVRDEPCGRCSRSPAARSRCSAARLRWRYRTSTSCSGSVSRPTSLTDDLDANLPPPRPIELREDDRLEPAEGEFGVVDPDGDGPPDQRRAEVRVRVAALTVGHARIIVAVTAPLRDEPLEEVLQVIDQRALELVDEQGAGRVQRVDQRDADGDGKLLNRIAHALGDIRDLGALVGRQRERGAIHLHGCALSEAHRLDWPVHRHIVAPRPNVTIPTYFW